MATATTLYNFDLPKRAIVTQNPLNDGTLTVYIPLPDGDFAELTAFDISTEAQQGYLATREQGAAKDQLYEVDLVAKTVTLTGTLGILDEITVLTVAPAGH